MTDKSSRLAQAAVLIVIGRLAVPLSLTMLLTHAYFGRPESVLRPAVGFVFGFLLLAGAASRLNDAKWLTSELVRGLGFAAMLVAATAVRFWFRRTPHHLSPRELNAALACGTGFLASVAWLRRDEIREAGKTRSGASFP